MNDIAKLREVVEKVGRALLTLVAAIDETCQHLEDGAKRLGSYGWPLSPTMGWDQVLAVMEMAERTSADEAFVHLYDQANGENIRTTVAALLANPAMTRWARILPQAEAAMERGHDALCVPALLAMVEGLVLPRSGMPAAVRAEASGHDAGSFEKLVWTTIDGFVSRAFKSSSFEGTEPAFLNRHWILHGRSAGAWTRTDCIRLLHVVRVLAEVRLEASASEE